MKQLLIICIGLGSFQPLRAQQTTQTVRGVVREDISQIPIVGATIRIGQAIDSVGRGTITNARGEFSITGVPTGRQTIRVTSIGYEEQQLPNVLVTAGKEVVLTIALTEAVEMLNEVAIVADRNDKVGPDNELAFVSGRAFNSEDTKRYAGSLGDPSRMAANFAGVLPGNDSRNDIVVRGNSSTGMLWQLEGLNIPNPNHFGSLNSTGGPVSLLNNNTLDKSDFLTGAFPAQYGNALSGVFDLRLREGNDQKREFVGQIGFNGFEVGAEGPFSKKSKASFLVNYRYSTLSVFKALGIQFGTGNAVPDYQDLTFKVAVPTGSNGKLSLFGIGGRSDVAFLGSEVDSTDNDLFSEANEDSRSNYSTTILGLSYEHTLSAKTFARLTLGRSSTDEAYSDDSISLVTRAVFPSGEARFKTQKYSAVLNLQHKLTARSSLYGGITVDWLSFSLFDRAFYEGGRYAVLRVNTAGNHSVLTQAYGQWRYRFSPRLLFTTGLHWQHHSLSRSTAVEPRAGLRYSFTGGQTLSLGYGLHSQTQNLYSYFVQTQLVSGPVYTNKCLGFTRSHQVVLSYENRLNKNSLLKIEPYYQALFDVPVERTQSSFSMLNTGGSFEAPEEDSLINAGTGRNMGVELTLERSFSRGYYFLITTSLFDSKYKGSDQIERNTAFNTRYVVNMLAGKEISVGRKRNSVLSASFKTSLIGGRYRSPIDRQASQLRGRTIYDEGRAFSERQSPYFRADLRLAYRKEMRRQTLEIAVDLQNVTNHKNIFRQRYDPQTNSLKTIYQQSFFPVPLVRYTF